MNFYWARSNNFLSVLLATAVAIVGVLTTLVMHQQHSQSTVNGQVRLRTVPTAPSASVPAGAKILAPPNAVTHLDPAPASDPALARVGPAAPPAPASAAPQAAPAVVAPAPRIITPPQMAPSSQKLLTVKTVPHRRVHPVAAPHPSAAVRPVIPAPQTGPAIPITSDAPVKPGSPDGN
jgi:hypothetical protein